MTNFVYIVSTDLNIWGSAQNPLGVSIFKSILSESGEELIRVAISPEEVVAEGGVTPELVENYRLAVRSVYSSAFDDLTDYVTGVSNSTLPPQGGSTYGSRLYTALFNLKVLNDECIRMATNE